VTPAGPELRIRIDARRSLERVVCASELQEAKAADLERIESHVLIRRPLTAALAQACI
jgi:hypothetical protein